jgi:hypothetical protein
MVFAIFIVLVLMFLNQLTAGEFKALLQVVLWLGMWAVIAVLLLIYFT